MRSGGLPSGARLSDKRARIREDHMKLYMHPVSMTSRPVRLFMAEKGLKADEELVDLMTGAQVKELLERHELMIGDRFVYEEDMLA